MQDFLPYPGRLVGVDYGTKRLGIAISDDAQTTALPRTIFVDDFWDRFDALLQEVHAVGIVVGLPQMFSGGLQQSGRSAQHFIAECAKRFSLPVFVVDERLTSKQARALLPGQKRIDDVAATIILQTYLDAAAKSRSV